MDKDSKVVYDTQVMPPAKCYVPQDWVVRRPFTEKVPPDNATIVSFDWVTNDYVSIPNVETVDKATMVALSDALNQLALDFYGGDTNG